MQRKLKEYFEAGTKAVWYVYPKTRQVVAYTSPESFTELSESDTLCMPARSCPVSRSI